MRCAKPAAARGFTLIELVLVIVLIGVLAVVVVPLTLTPFTAFRDQERRAAMVAEAEAAMLRVTREVRHALPNSLRVSAGGQAVEFLETVDGGRYRRTPDLSDPASPAGNLLDVPGPDDGFDVLTPGLGIVPGQFVVIYNTEPVGNLPTNAYFGGNRSAVTGLAAGQLTFDAHSFPAHSPAQRFDIVSGPVSFICSGSAPNIVLSRCAGYPIQSAQPAACPAGGNASPLLVGLSACAFQYAPGSSTRAGVLTARLTLTRSDDRGQSESLPLVGQAQVWNTP